MGQNRAIIGKWQPLHVDVPSKDGHASGSVMAFRLVDEKGQHFQWNAFQATSVCMDARSVICTTQGNVITARDNLLDANSSSSSSSSKKGVAN